MTHLQVRQAWGMVVALVVGAALLSVPGCQQEQVSRGSEDSIGQQATLVYPYSDGD